MKATFESEDPKEILRLAKSLDMACALFKILYNLPLSVTDTPMDYHKKVHDVIEAHGINMDELLD